MLLGRGARVRKGSGRLSNGTCVLGDCVRLGFLTDLLLFLLVLSQDGNEIVRNRLLEL